MDVGSLDLNYLDKSNNNQSELGEINIIVWNFNDSQFDWLIKEEPGKIKFVAIYYKRENSNWFTESLYRKRVRFSFQEGIIQLDRTNFWDWFELNEIKVVIIY